MNDATAPKVVEPQDGAKKPGSTGANWLSLIGALCIVVSTFVPQHAFAHKALVLLMLVLFAFGDYRSYLRIAFVLLGLAYVIVWLYPGIGWPFFLLVFLPPTAVGVIGAVRDRRKSLR